MIWGELQSVIQLASALNAIYLGLYDIRNPYVRSEEKSLNSLSSAITDRIAKATNDRERDAIAPIASDLGDLHATFAGELKAFDTKDTWVGKACLIAVFTYIILLIVSGFFYNSQVDFLTTVSISTLGFLPITAGLWLNVSLVRRMSERVRKRRFDIEIQLVPKSSPPVSPAPGRHPGV